MTHRAADVRFMVLDIHEHEFKIFYSYILWFIHTASINPKVKEVSSSARYYDNVRRLRKLREQDPELYNLKKHGSTKTYSVICQNPHQPMIYTKDEVANMSAAEVRRLTQYWNFTLKKPAYYGCPSKEYPNLSYIVGVHPKKYCLPCCKKLPQNTEDSSKLDIYKECAQRHVYTGETSSDPQSRHIMRYGKPLDVGRLSKLPLDIESASGAYFIYGVSQHFPAINNMGIIYAVADALGMTAQTLIGKIISRLSRPAISSVFTTFMNGSLTDYFTDMHDFTSTMRSMFLNISTVNPKPGFTSWPELFVEIIHISLHVSVFIIIDVNKLYVQSVIADELLYGGGANRYVVLAKLKTRYYPVYEINLPVFFRTHEIQTKIYDAESPMGHLLQNMVAFHGAKTVQASRLFDLNGAKEYAKASNVMIKCKYIGKRNLCYAVSIEGVYCPVHYSAYISDGIPIIFENVDRSTISRDNVVKMLKSINDFALDNGYAALLPAENISYNGNIIGLRSAGNLMWYHMDVPIGDDQMPTRAQGLAYAAASVHVRPPAQAASVHVRPPAQAASVHVRPPAQSQDADNIVVNVSVDYTDVNRAILARESPNADNRINMLGSALYNNYIYQLFLVEFVNYISNERNVAVREQIHSLISSANLKKNMGGVRKLLKQILIDDNDKPSTYDDYVQIRDQIRPDMDKKSIIDSINKTTYGFDRMTLRRLTKDNLRSVLMEVAAKFTVERDIDTTHMAFPNIYMPCDNNEASYCANNRLIINKPLPELVDLLSADLSDDLKREYITKGVWLDITVSYFDFIKRPEEIVHVYRLTE
jgi:hypothetical protein